MLVWGEGLGLRNAIRRAVVLVPACGHSADQRLFKLTLRLRGPVGQK